MPTIRRATASGMLLTLAACVGDQSSEAAQAFAQLAKAANQFADQAQKMALTMKVKREGTEGFERSTEVAGFPAFEQWTSGVARAGWR